MTARETEVAELIAEGLTNDQIAQRLVVTTGTAANHVAHIIEKLGLQSRVQVAAMVVRDQSRAESKAILDLLDVLRQVDSGSAQDALQHATDVLAAGFVAEKVDAFLYDEVLKTLVAVGTSHTPLGELQ